MGVFRRLTESAMQTIPGAASIRGSEWKATSNERNKAMLVDCDKFAKSLKSLQAEMNYWDKSVSTGLKTFTTVMRTNLPKIYEDSPEGAVPTEAGEIPVGVGVDIAAIEQASEEMHTRVQNEVIKPLDEWLKAHLAIKERYNELESLRLDLDSRRRSAQSASDKYATGKLKNGTNLDKLSFKAQSEEEKVGLTTARYLTLELEVNTSLHALIKDTGVLREYVASGLLVMQTAFTRSYNAFDLSVAPIMRQTTLSHGAGAPQPPGTDYGNPPTQDYGNPPM